jgi:DNA-binding NarL/FixJ family response regulator
MSILVVDDHWMVRRGLAEVLAPLAVTGGLHEASTLREAFAFVRSAGKTPVTIVLDAMIGNESGLSSIEGLKSAGSSVRVLVLSYLPEDPNGVRAIELGADGYLSKGGSAQEFVEAVRSVMSGQKYVSPALARLLAERVSHGEELTPREWEVVRYYVLGYGCVKTAKVLSLSPKTVSTHKANVMRKLGLRSTADLIRWGLERNIA